MSTNAIKNFPERCQRFHLLLYQNGRVKGQHRKLFFGKTIDMLKEVHVLSSWSVNAVWLEVYGLLSSCYIHIISNTHIQYAKRRPLHCFSGKAFFAGLNSICQFRPLFFIPCCKGDSFTDTWKLLHTYYTHYVVHLNIEMKRTTRNTTRITMSEIAIRKTEDWQWRLSIWSWAESKKKLKQIKQKNGNCDSYKTFVTTFVVRKLLNFQVVVIEQSQTTV